MFTRSAEYYDMIYAALGKDYRAEASRLNLLIRRHKRSKGRRLLDVACGTGRHARELARHYQVEGLDADRKLLAIARRANPLLTFHVGDMLNFRLGGKFDVITCLFSSIGYVRTEPRLRATVKRMAGHLVPGGVLIIEPWFSTHPRTGPVRIISATECSDSVVRMSRLRRRGGLSVIEFHYLIGTPAGIQHASEQHVLGLFAHAAYKRAFREAGLPVIHDRSGLTGRGLYIGTRPL